MELQNHLSDDSRYAMCQHCDTKYERFTIFYTKDEDTLRRREWIREVMEWEHLCKDCFVEAMEPHKGFGFFD